ncbi:CpsD/CapB family tyrosine-protein kinase [Alkalimarinus coralli]|uniref:CpsD/CapB family tyrosine-protein kinase n=1 Tax=Alkalimarinus coralli TaxID=2935863 RepID=UPI00202B0365|nr:CpsD/CapB family tyrosine-protein kinase [Alkalimarinus coralli]
MDRIAQALKLAKEEHTLDMPKSRANVSPATGYSGAEGDPLSPESAPVKTIEIPEDFLRKQKVISSYWEEPIADAFRLLRTRILQRMSQNGWKSLGITSVEPKNGKSLTTINLGIAIAKEPGQSVIVVDTDFRRPSTHQYFGIEPEKGIEDFLLNGAAVESLLFSPGIEDFAVLPCSEKIRGGPELLKSPKMLELVTTLRRLHPNHIIIYDLPPILIGDDAIAFSTFVDAMLLVVEDGVTQDKSLKQAKELLSGVNLIGTVLNKAPGNGSNYKDYY